MLPYQTSQNSFLFETEQVGNPNGSLGPYTTLHIPMCTTSHVPIHLIGSGQQRTWSLAPCHGTLPAHMTLQPCCTAPHGVAPHFMTAAPAHFYHHPMPPPPPPQYNFSHFAPQPMHSVYNHESHHQQPQQQQQHSHNHHQQQQMNYTNLPHQLPMSNYLSAMPSLHQFHDEAPREHQQRRQHHSPPQYVGIPPSSSSATQHQNGSSHLALPGQPPPTAMVMQDRGLVHRPVIGPSPQDFGVSSMHRVRRASSSRQRWRNMPPPYPGFVLHFQSTFARPSMTTATARFHFQDLLSGETVDLDSYEALLSLADRLGDVKSRGLTRAKIESFRSYRFNAEMHRATPVSAAVNAGSTSASFTMQTSCVICLAEFESKQLLRVLPCRHEFHARCIDKWLKVNRTCPICRDDTLESHKSESSA